MYTKKDIKKLELLAKQYNIEIIAVCKKCNTHWCTLEENRFIHNCDICKTGNFIEHYCDFEDCFRAIENLTKHNNDLKKVCSKCGIELNSEYTIEEDIYVTDVW